MVDLFSNINVDWMGIRKPLIAVSVLVLLAGLVSAIGRQITPGGTDAFNLGVDFQGGSVVTVKFRDGKPKVDEIRNALQSVGVDQAVIQESIDKQDEVLIKTPLLEGEAGTKNTSNTKSSTIKENLNSANANSNTNSSANTESNTETNANANIAANVNNEEDINQVDAGRKLVQQALNTFGKEAPTGVELNQATGAKYKIVGTDSVGPVAGEQLRNKAIIATLLGMFGILFFIAFRYDWTYAAGAVIAVFHDVLITLAFFTMFQWEVSLTVLAALLTLVGFSVNDSIVIFDRIRENVTLNRNKSIYDLTNTSINQTMSRTIVTNGLVFLAVLALVLFGGEVLRGFSLALFVGSITGTYSTVAIASPIAIWWQSKLGETKMKDKSLEKDKNKLASAARGSVRRRPVSK